MKCCFVPGKSRVAPIKSVSVPRLELTAAVLAAKMTNFVVNELDISFSKVILWTDSTVVLRCLRSTSIRFTTFVANRLEVLHALTTVEQWHSVPSKQNPADIASRGVWPDKCNACDLWFNGPPFLKYDISEWPNQPSFLRNLTCDDPEVKSTEFCFANLHGQSDNSLQRLFARYSNFHGLLRTVAWLLQYKKYLSNKRLNRCYSLQTGLLRGSELEEAKLEIIKAVQRETFPEAFKTLQNHADFDAPRTLLQDNDLRHNKELRELQTLNPYIVNGVLPALSNFVAK